MTNNENQTASERLAQQRHWKLFNRSDEEWFKKQRLAPTPVIEPIKVNKLRRARRSAQRLAKQRTHSR